ncbi:hypothetical protein BDQ12DRAFT_690090 [Crucibulum laeve]|uniref:AMP-dependent synthetase/ligase domain-containing protein n=1 Tax=Crucibulum laeve TaxID=68775 RepID=A0A5C3LZJ8_9AGAR|nr:hypothetical protein BDQ12DRAFT_690090 [Crucibulum laeve]
MDISSSSVSNAWAKLATSSGTSACMLHPTTSSPWLSSSGTSSISTITSPPTSSPASTRTPVSLIRARIRRSSAYVKECDGIRKKNGFKPMELLQSVVLISDEWTPESGLVTAGQRIQRSKIAKAFKAKINGVYRSD